MSFSVPPRSCVDHGVRISCCVRRRCECYPLSVVHHRLYQRCKSSHTTVRPACTTGALIVPLAQADHEEVYAPGSGPQMAHPLKASHQAHLRSHTGQLHDGAAPSGTGVAKIDGESAPAYEEDEERRHAQNLNKRPQHTRSSKVERPTLSVKPTINLDAGPDGVTHARVPVLTVFIYTVLMSAASGLGALPFLFTQRLSDSWAGIANAVGSGVMLAASFDLLHEGAPYSAVLTITGMILGALFVMVREHWELR